MEIKNEKKFLGSLMVLTIGAALMATKPVKDALARGLVRYNNRHTHSQIYADVPYSLRYSFHILH